jgi:heme a synthase
MDDSARRVRLLRRMALLCAALVLVITSLSAFLRLTQAGLGCADWPQCYGRALAAQQQGMPVATDGARATALARLAHRVAASAALLLIVVMAMTCLATRPAWWRAGRLALALLALALLLALLGRFSSGARVPAVAIGNLLGGFLMLALAWRLVRDTAPHSAAAAPPLRSLARLCIVLLLAQIALGGLVSAGLAGRACPELLAGCTTSGLSWQALDPWREPLLDTARPGHTAGALLQQVHRLGALLVVGLLLPLGLAAWRRGPRRAGGVLLGLLALQLALGAGLVVRDLPLALALGHNLVAALLLATLFDLARTPAALR